MKDKLIKLSLIFSMLFIFNISASALSYNESAEDLWGGWDKGVSLTNSTYLKWSCEVLSDPYNVLTVSNSNNGCTIISKDVFNDHKTQIRITQTNNGKSTNKSKYLNMKTNAVKATIKVNQTYDAGSDFKKLGLKAYLNCNKFTVSPSSILTKGDCGTHLFKATTKSTGTGTIQVESLTGIKFKTILTVTDNKTQTSTTTRVTETKPQGTTSKNTTTRSRTTEKSQSKTPVVEIPVREKVQTEIYEERYVGNYNDVSFQGNNVSCGDIVKVTTCDESTGASSTCNVESINGVRVTGTKVYRQKLVSTKPTCSDIKRYALSGATYYISPDLDTRERSMACGEELTFEKTPVEACVFGKTVNSSTNSNAKDFCEVNYNGRTVYVDRTKLAYEEPVCFEKVTETEDEEEPQKYIADVCRPERPVKDVTSSRNKKIPICYTYENREFKVNGPDEREMFSCASGYRRYIKEDIENNTCINLKSSRERQSCYRTYIYSCRSVSKPRVHGTGSLATPDGIGTIAIKGYDSTTDTGLRGYIINNGIKPTIDSDWTLFVNNEHEATESKTSGTYFAWTLTNDNVVSYPISLTIADDDITTTVSEIILSNPDNGENIPFTNSTDNTIGYGNGIRKSEYVRLSNHLMNDSVLATGFSLFNTSYDLTTDSNKIAVHATLTNEETSYVPGFEPRTVDLDFGRNVILVKTMNTKGATRTYTFVVNREDNRSSDNTLKTLTTSIGTINFDPYISDYTITVPKNAKSVNINGTLDSLTSSFVKGFEPRKVDLNNNITSAVLRTVSESGITRNYVLTFIKTGTKDKELLENSTFLSSLTIPGTDIIFNKETISYTVALPFEIEDIPVFALPESSEAEVTINGNTGLKVGANTVEIIVNNKNLTKIYNVSIIRKEDGLEISTNTKLKTLTVKDYDLLFYEDVYDYTVKINRERSLMLTATPQSNRSQVYMYGNNDLTAFSTVRVKVIAESGDTSLYSVDIIKDTNNKKQEITMIIIGSIIIFGSGIIIVIQKRRKKIKEYLEG